MRFRLLTEHQTQTKLLFPNSRQPCLEKLQLHPDNLTLWQMYKNLCGGKVCVHHDAQLKSLKELYDEFSKIIHRKSKNLLLHANGKEDRASIERLKNATVLLSDTQDQEWVNEGPHSPESVPKPPSRDLSNSATLNVSVTLHNIPPLEYSAASDSALLSPTPSNNRGRLFGSAHRYLWSIPSLSPAHRYSCQRGVLSNQTTANDQRPAPTRSNGFIG